MAQEPGQKAGATQEFSAQNATQLARFHGQAADGSGGGLSERRGRPQQSAAYLL